MKSFEHYKNTFFTTAERGLGDYRVGTEKTIDLFKKTVGLDTSRAERLIAVFKLIKEFLPQNAVTDKMIESFSADPSRMPFDFQRFSFEGKIGRGAQCEAFLLSSKEQGLPSYVVKMQNGVTPEMQAPTLAETAKNLKNEYEFIRDMYEELPEIIPPEFTIILENIALTRFVKKPQIAFIQRFYGKDIKDFFKEVSLDEILSLCRLDVNFLVSLKKFIDITLKTYEEKGIIVDFFGPKNLAVINQEGHFSLMLLDPHVIYSNKDMKSWNNIEAQKAIDYLTHLQGLLEHLS